MYNVYADPLVMQIDLLPKTTATTTQRNSSHRIVCPLRLEIDPSTESSESGVENQPSGPAQTEETDADIEKIRDGG